MSRPKSTWPTRYGPLPMGMSSMIWSNGLPAPQSRLNTGMLPTIRGSSALGLRKWNWTARSPSTTASLTSANMAR